MRLYKTTKYKACFRENGDRIGRIYLPLSFVQKMQINDEITLQLAKAKELLPVGGYRAACVIDKETEKKMRFVEDIGERGELGLIYINKNILHYLDTTKQVAVRISTPACKREGEAIES
ncbi:MAG: hypothetical protein FH758_03920 [Firmicutes bacterium]|nr:hypothetical protein [Bacillota bacterium]